MKIRNGFVSNSSSSSFMLIGKPLTYKEALEQDYSKDNVVMIGELLSDGMDMVEMSDSFRKFMLENGFDGDYPFYKVFIMGEDGQQFNAKTIGEDLVTIRVFDIDYHCTQDIQQFKEVYEEHYVKPSDKYEEILKEIK